MEPMGDALPSVKLTCLRLKMDGWNTIASCWEGLTTFSSAFTVSCRAFFCECWWQICFQRQNENCVFWDKAQLAAHCSPYRHLPFISSSWTGSMWWILEFLQISVATFSGYFKKNFLEQMWRLASANCTRSWASSTKKTQFRTSWTHWLKLWSAKRVRLHPSSQLGQQNVPTCKFVSKDGWWKYP